MTRWGVMAGVGAMAFGAVLPGRAQSPPTGASLGRPDVLVLVYQQPGQADLVDITYAHTVRTPRRSATWGRWHKPQDGPWGRAASQDGSAPVQRTMPMTSSVFTAPHVIQGETHTLPVEPFITAFRSYQRLTLIFSVAPGFQFQSPRGYTDNNVQIAAEQRGTVFTYQVRVLNPQFTHLKLPQPTLRGAPRRIALRPGSYFSAF